MHLCLVLDLLSKSDRYNASNVLTRLFVLNFPFTELVRRAAGPVQGFCRTVLVFNCTLRPDLLSEQNFAS